MRKEILVFFNLNLNFFVDEELTSLTSKSGALSSKTHSNKLSAFEALIFS